jgi:hypothetical protein
MRAEANGRHSDSSHSDTEFEHAVVYDVNRDV